MQRRDFVLAASGLLASTSIGAAAYTNADVSRDVTIGIAQDNNAIIGLAPGSTSAVELVDDQLVIDTSTSNSNGLNPNGTFDYGDASSPTSTFAFSITNNDATQRDFDLSLTGFSISGSASLTFSVYDDTGSLTGDLQPGSSLTQTLSSAQSAYVIISIDTSGLTASDDLNGTFDISAT